MSTKTSDTFWDVRPLGDLPPTERAAFYDNLEDMQPEEHLFLASTSSHLYENPRFEVAILEPDGRIVRAQGYKARPTIADTPVNVYLERYYAEAMPGKNFDLQLGISSRHYFKDRKEPEVVAHTLTVRGVLHDYANYLSEPVFRELAVTKDLTLDIVVNFLSDKTTKKFTSIIDNDATRKGIQLLGAYNPVFATAATYAKGLVKMFLEAKGNHAVTDAHVGLLSTPGELSAPLVEGTYLLIQPSATEPAIDFTRASYDFNRNRLTIGGTSECRNHAFLRIQKAS